MPAAAATACGTTSSASSATASPATPPCAMPSSRRRPSMASNVGARTPVSAHALAETIETTMARRRPHRSPATDHGTTDRARPSVLAETSRAARSAGTPRSSLTSGSRPCGE
ncbi:hypothetical protein AUV08_08720 [Micrococcus sp. CH7]|nr:hypothetical protein AUV08_08720 [Micrococcus sp. CH7]